MTSDTATSSHADTVILTRDLCWQWPGQAARLRFPDITLPPGEHLFIRGASGTGKSTLLSLLSGMNRSMTGTLTVHGQELTQLSGGARDRLRADRIGVIFQQFNLVPYLDTLGNVLLPCHLSAHRRHQAGDSPPAAARRLLAALGLPEECLGRKPARLSTGQQQRVAAARALIGSPDLILADEPTSALDTLNRDRFVRLLLDQAANSGSSVVFVSHDPALAGHFERHLELTPTMGDQP
ncbi:ATP-binding cassette domain-containing protein [Marinobacter daqiaonensis]|nr:ATP-binding cassette domain-containing protein [Marinobacter daqiaonensis]